MPNKYFRDGGKKHAVAPDRLEPTDLGSVATMNHPGSNYSPAECEFIKAVAAFQRKERRKFLAHVDYLRIAVAIGYCRTPATTPPPPQTPDATLLPA